MVAGLNRLTVCVVVNQGAWNPHLTTEISCHRRYRDWRLVYWHGYLFAVVE